MYGMTTFQPHFTQKEISYRLILPSPFATLSYHCTGLLNTLVHQCTDIELIRPTSYLGSGCLFIQYDTCLWPSNVKCNLCKMIFTQFFLDEICYASSYKSNQALRRTCKLKKFYFANIFMNFLSNFEYFNITIVTYENIIL